MAERACPVIAMAHGTARVGERRTGNHPLKLGAVHNHIRLYWVGGVTNRLPPIWGTGNWNANLGGEFNLWRRTWADWAVLFTVSFIPIESSCPVLMKFNSLSVFRIVISPAYWYKKPIHDENTTQQINGHRNRVICDYTETWPRQRMPVFDGILVKSNL